MCALVEANLDLCQIPEEQTLVIQSEAARFLQHRSTEGSLKASGPWGLIFFDPPYATDYLAVLELIGSNATDLLGAGGLLIVEHHHKNTLTDGVGSIVRRRVLKQGDSSLSFYEVGAGNA